MKRYVRRHTIQSEFRRLNKRLDSFEAALYHHEHNHHSLPSKIKDGIPWSAILLTIGIAYQVAANLLSRGA